MSKVVSFTEGRSVRYPAPDVARGFMLILIALANVGVWAKAISPQTHYTQLDEIFTVLRVSLINQRAYPLFAMLFGFGLMTMVMRRQANYLSKASATGEDRSVDTEEDSGEDSGLASFSVDARQIREQSISDAARRDARSLLRRRGWWMLLFGLVHGLIFPGDIIGTYAIVAVVFAGLIVRQRFQAMIILGIVPVLLGAASAAMTPYKESAEGFQLIVLSYWPMDIVRNFGIWTVATISGNLFTPIILSTAIGAYLATTDIMTHPERHRRLLLMSAVLGLMAAFVLGAPGGLFMAGVVDWEASWWMYVAAFVGGPLGAWGWLSLLALFAGPAPATGELRGVRWVLSAVGRRSMTAYLLQTIIFLAIFVGVEAAGAPVSETTNVLFAWVAWLLPAALCVALEYAGKRGPFEVLLRTAVTATAKPVPLPSVQTPMEGSMEKQSDARPPEVVAGQESSQ